MIPIMAMKLDNKSCLGFNLCPIKLVAKVITVMIKIGKYTMAKSNAAFCRHSVLAKFASQPSGQL
jgi:hypothetical protein